MNRFEMLLVLRPGFSRWLAGLLILAHGGAALIVVLVALPWWFKCGVMAAIAVNLRHAYSWHLLHRGRGMVEAWSWADGRWEVRCFNDAVSRPATLAADSLVLAWLTILVFRLDDGRVRALLLLPDNIDAAVFRRLRVRLRFPSGKDADPSVSDSLS
jgi:hypothetical protein